MKKIFNFIKDVLESYGRARAASALANIGRYSEARKLMTKE